MNRSSPLAQVQAIEKSLVCCGRQFKDKKNLDQHKTSRQHSKHVGDTPLVKARCQCGLAFTRKDGLRKHLARRACSSPRNRKLSKPIAANIGEVRREHRPSVPDSPVLPEGTVFNEADVMDLLSCPSDFDVADLMDFDWTAFETAQSSLPSNLSEAISAVTAATGQQEPEHSHILRRSSQRCPMCTKTLPHNKTLIASHLKAHLASDRRHTCHVCEIDFVHARNLEFHQAWSKKHKTCGYGFLHATECSGHHPPPKREAVVTRTSDHYRLKFLCLLNWNNFLDQLMIHQTTVYVEHVANSQTPLIHPASTSLSDRVLAFSMESLSILSAPVLNGSGFHRTWKFPQAKYVGRTRRPPIAPTLTPVADYSGHPLLKVDLLAEQVRKLKVVTEAVEEVKQARQSELARQLRLACMENDIAAVNRCLAAGANVNLSSDLPWDVPLMEAARLGHDTIVSRLLEAGADIDPKFDHRGTVLAQAIIRRRLSTVSLLVKRGARLDRVYGKCDAIALAMAFEYDDVVVAIEQGALGRA